MLWIAAPYSPKLDGGGRGRVLEWSFISTEYRVSYGKYGMWCPSLFFDDKNNQRSWCPGEILNDMIATLYCYFLFVILYSFIHCSFRIFLPFKVWISTCLLKNARMSLGGGFFAFKPWNTIRLTSELVRGDLWTGTCYLVYLFICWKFCILTHCLPIGLYSKVDKLPNLEGNLCYVVSSYWDYELTYANPKLLL